MRARLLPHSLILTVLASNLTLATPAPQPAGTLSLVDAEGMKLEVIEVQAWQACIRTGRTPAACASRHARAVRFMPEMVTQAVEQQLEAHWQDFKRRATDRISRKLNELPPCFVPAPCPSIIVNWGCVAQRQAQGVLKVVKDDLPNYWKDVHQTILTRLPLALWWRGAVPGQGAVIAPVFSLVPKPQQYAGLIREPRDGPYYFRQGQKPPVRYSRNELGPPGIAAKEEVKRRLERATLMEYERFGFASFFQVYGGFEEVLLTPVLVVVCLTPFPAPVPIPNLTLIPRVPKAFTSYESVPEGYGIPRVIAKPLLP
jgi:hypothetical protein